VEAAKKRWGAKEAEEAALTLEISELKKTIGEAGEQLSSTEEAIKGFAGIVFLPARACSSRVYILLFVLQNSFA
jgi:hypothetical protein